MMLARRLVVAVVPLLVARVACGQSMPTGWRWAPDAREHDSASVFSEMPPGWHITTRDAGALWSSSIQASGRFVVESEYFLFPESENAGFGIFIGGRDLDASATLLAFLMRRDGQVAIEHRTAGASTMLASWSPAPGLAAHGGTDAEKHVMRVSAERDSLRVDIDGRRAMTLARGTLPADGLVGFRIGRGMNLHVTSLDITTRLAPPAARR